MSIVTVVLQLFAFVLAGFLVKHFNLLHKSRGEQISKFVLRFLLPPAIFLSIARQKLSLGLLSIPVSAVVIVLVTFFVSLAVAEKLRLPRKTKGAFIVCTCSLNSAYFAFPIFISAYGLEGLARTALFDSPNALLLYTFVYSIASYYGGRGSDIKRSLQKVLLSPVFLAVALGLVASHYRLALPSESEGVFWLLSLVIPPLMMLVLGLFLELKMQAPVALAAGVIVRLLLGLAIGLVLVTLFNLTGLDRMVVLLNSAMPVAIAAILFASAEKLDVEFAASLTSFSILLGIAWIPLLLLIL